MRGSFLNVFFLAEIIYHTIIRQSYRGLLSVAEDYISRVEDNRETINVNNDLKA